MAFGKSPNVTNKLVKCSNRHFVASSIPDDSKTESWCYGKDHSCGTALPTSRFVSRHEPATVGHRCPLRQIGNEQIASDSVY